MGDLSNHFSGYEFTCHHCGGLGVSMKLVYALQELRDLAGVPIGVTSGYRCPDHPLTIKRPTSCHAKGLAADIVITGHTVIQMAKLAESVPAFAEGGIGLYPFNGFIHVDVRREKGRWGRIQGNRYVSYHAAIVAARGLSERDQ